MHTAHITTGFQNQTILAAASLILAAFCLFTASPTFAGQTLSAGEAYEMTSGNLGLATGCVTVKALHGSARVQGQIVETHGELKAANTVGQTTKITIKKTAKLTKGKKLSADYKGPCRVYVEEGTVEILSDHTTGGGCSDKLGLR